MAYNDVTICDFLCGATWWKFMVCRLNNRVKYRLTHERKRVETTGGLEIAVADRGLPSGIVYDSYRGKAVSENRIRQLKYDFSIDDFVTHSFRATELAGTL